MELGLGLISYVVLLPCRTKYILLFSPEYNILNLVRRGARRMKLGDSNYVIPEYSPENMLLVSDTSQFTQNKNNREHILLLWKPCDHDYRNMCLVTLLFDGV